MIEDLARLKHHWLVACSASELKHQPVAATVLGVPLVLFRSGSKIVVAEDRCPHRNAPLSTGQCTAQHLRCPYHGWTFDADGRCVEAPGMSAAELPPVSLRLWQARQQAGYIWVAPRNSSPTVLPYEPKLLAGNAHRCLQFSSEITATIADGIENLLDGTHTPFVHAGLVRSPHAKQQFTATVTRHEDYVEAEYRGEKRQAGWLSRWFEPSRELSAGRFHPPCTAELEYRSKQRTELLVVAHFTPVNDGVLRVFISTYLPTQGLIPVALRLAFVKPFFGRILLQDREILKQQYANLKRFGEPRYVHWRADLLRQWIDAWYQTGQFPEQSSGPESHEFWL